MAKVDLLKGSIWKSLILFALPTFFAYLLSYLYNAIDIFILSASGHESEMSIISSAYTPITLVTSLCIGISLGGTFLIGQYFGAGDTKGMKKSIASLSVTMMGLTLFFAIAIAAMSSLIVDWLNIDPSLREDAIRYLLLQCITIPLIGMVYIVNAVFRGQGNSVLPFVYSGSGIVINILLDVLFIYFLGMKTDGAALSSILSYAVSTVGVIIYIIAKKKWPTGEGRYKVEWLMIKRMVKYGLPLALQEAMVTISFTVMVTMMNTRGINASNVIAISDRISNIAYVPLLAINYSMSAAAAQNLGAYQIDRTRKFFRYGVISCLISAIGFSLPILLTSLWTSGIYTANGDIQYEVFLRCVIITIDLLLCILLCPLSGLTSGSGHSNWSFMAYFLSDALIRIPLTIILAHFGYDIFIVSLAWPLSTVLALIIYLVFYKKGYWKNLKSLPVTEDIRREIAGN